MVVLDASTDGVAVIVTPVNAVAALAFESVLLRLALTAAMAVSPDVCIRMRMLTLAAVISNCPFLLVQRAPQCLHPNFALLHFVLHRL